MFFRVTDECSARGCGRFPIVLFQVLVSWSSTKQEAMNFHWSSCPPQRAILGACSAVVKSVGAYIFFGNEGREQPIDLGNTSVEDCVYPSRCAYPPAKTIMVSSLGASVTGPGKRYCVMIKIVNSTSHRPPH